LPIVNGGLLAPDESLAQDLREAQSELERWRDEAQELRKRVVELAPFEAAYTAARAEADGLLAALDTARAEARLADKARAEHLESLRVHNAQMRNELAQFQNQWQSLQAEHERVSGDLLTRTLESEQVERSRHALGEARAANARLQSLLAEAQARIADRQATIAALARVNEDLTAIRAERDRFQAELETARVAAREHSLERQNLESGRIETQRQWLAREEQFALKLQEAEAGWEAARGAMQSHWNQERQDWAREASRATENRTLAEAAQERLQGEIEQTRQQIEIERAAIAAERERAKAATEDLPQELERVSAERDLIQSMHDDAARRHVVEVADLRAAETRAQRQAEDLAHRNEQLARQADELQTDLRRAHAELIATRQQFDNTLAAFQREMATVRAGVRRGPGSTPVNAKAQPARPEPASSSGPALPAEVAAAYADVALGSYNSEAFKNLMKKAREGERSPPAAW
jgi:chromosome segregation ATPase